MKSFTIENTPHVRIHRTEYTTPAASHWKSIYCLNFTTAAYHRMLCGPSPVSFTHTATLCICGRSPWRRMALHPHSVTTVTLCIVYVTCWKVKFDYRETQFGGTGKGTGESLFESSALKSDFALICSSVWGSLVSLLLIRTHCYVRGTHFSKPCPFVVIVRGMFAVFPPLRFDSSTLSYSRSRELSFSRSLTLRYARLLMGTVPGKVMPVKSSVIVSAESCSERGISANISKAKSLFM